MKSSNRMRDEKYVLLPEKKIKKKILMIRKYCKVGNHCHYTVKYRGAALSIFNLRYSIPKEIPFSQWIKLSLSFYHKRAK